MRTRWILSTLALLAVLAIALLRITSARKESRAAAGPTADRTADGKPDFSGVWQRARPETFGIIQRHEALPPFTAWGQEQFNRVKNTEDPYERANDALDPSQKYCYPYGIPRVHTYNVYPMEIVQATGKVYMLYELDYEVRRIYTDGRGHPKDLNPTFMGDSIGRWEGDILVVDTVGLNDKNWIDMTGLPHSEGLHFMERIRRPDHTHLVSEMTIDDPKTYTKPWTERKTWELHPDWQIGEFNICEDKQTN